MVKNLVTFSLVIFVIVVIAVLGMAVFGNNGNTSAGPVAQQGVVATVVTTTPASSAKTISSAEVAQHGTASDCWLIVSDKVYNVTNLIPIHSGGPGQIIPYCGKDATNAFDTKNGRGSHSQRAQDALNNYYVGDLTR